MTSSWSGAYARGMRLLFLHGAGGEEAGRALAAELAAAVGADPLVPSLPAEDFAREAWTAPITHALEGLDAEDLVIGHSFGASMLLHALAERPDVPWTVHLLGMPDWGPEGWDVPDYVLTPAAVEGLSGIALHLHHTADDEVVPLAHLDLHAACFPSASVHRHPVGGHLFTGCAATVLGPDGAPA